MTRTRLLAFLLIFGPGPQGAIAQADGGNVCSSEASKTQPDGVDGVLKCSSESADTTFSAKSGNQTIASQFPKDQDAIVSTEETPPSDTVVSSDKQAPEESETLADWFHTSDKCVFAQYPVRDRWTHSLDPRGGIIPEKLPLSKDFLKAWKDKRSTASWPRTRVSLGPRKKRTFADLIRKRGFAFEAPPPKKRSGKRGKRNKSKKQQKTISEETKEPQTVHLTLHNGRGGWKRPKTYIPYYAISAIFAKSKRITYHALRHIVTAIFGTTGFSAVDSDSSVSASHSMDIDSGTNVTTAIETEGISVANVNTSPRPALAHEQQCPQLVLPTWFFPEDCFGFFFEYEGYLKRVEENLRKEIDMNKESALNVENQNATDGKRSDSEPAESGSAQTKSRKKGRKKGKKQGTRKNKHTIRTTIHEGLHFLYKADLGSQGKGINMLSGRYLLRRVKLSCCSSGKASVDRCLRDMEIRYNQTNSFSIMSSMINGTSSDSPNHLVDPEIFQNLVSSTELVKQKYENKRKEAARKKYGTMEKNMEKNSKRRKSSKRTEKSEKKKQSEADAKYFHLQKLLHPPFLLNNHKFDMRIHVFVARSNPLVVYATPYFLRRSILPYSTKKIDSALTAMITGSKIANFTYEFTQLFPNMTECELWKEGRRRMLFSEGKKDLSQINDMSASECTQMVENAIVTSVETVTSMEGTPNLADLFVKVWRSKTMPQIHALLGKVLTGFAELERFRKSNWTFSDWSLESKAVESGIAVYSSQNRGDNFVKGHQSSEHLSSELRAAQELHRFVYFGCDFIFDEKLNAYFLEINSQPNFGADPHHKEFFENLYAGMFDIVKELHGPDAQEKYFPPNGANGIRNANGNRHNNTERNSTEALRNLGRDVLGNPDFTFELLFNEWDERKEGGF